MARLDKEERAAEALLLVARWGRLRPQELGRLLYGYAEHARKYAEVHCRKLEALGLVLARKLPGGIRTGTAYVLAEAGARWLAKVNGAGFSSGKDWGSTKGEQWKPPGCWRHDLRAYGVLSHLAALGYAVLPERVIRGDEPRSSKHPDGLITNAGAGWTLWLEVEGARKSGALYLAPMARALAAAARGEPVQHYDAVQHAPIRGAAVAFDPEARDERGYRKDHWGTIERAMAKEIKEPVAVSVILVEPDAGGGVKGIRLERRTVQPAGA